MEKIIKTTNQFLKRYNLKALDLPIWIIGLAIVIAWISPFFWMVSTSLKETSEILTLNNDWIPKTFTLDSYKMIFEWYPVTTWAMNSVIQAVASTFLCILFGSMAGYALARLQFPGRDMIFLILIASIMIPGEVYVIPLLLGILKVGLANTYLSLILPTVANVICVYIFRQFFMTFPKELEESSKIDGATSLQIYWFVALPMARAPMIAAAVIIFTLNWNSFLWPLLVIFEEEMKTMPIGIAVFASVHGHHTQLDAFGVAMAGSTLLSIPSLFVFFVLQRYFVQGISTGGIKA